MKLVSLINDYPCWEFKSKFYSTLLPGPFDSLDEVHGLFQSISGCRDLANATEALLSKKSKSSALKFCNVIYHSQSNDIAYWVMACSIVCSSISPDSEAWRYCRQEISKYA